MVGLEEEESMSDTCGTCRYGQFFEAVHDEGNIPLGRCRRRAPVKREWSEVLEQDWCGDFEAKEEATGHVFEGTVCTRCGLSWSVLDCLADDRTNIERRA